MALVLLVISAQTRHQNPGPIWLNSADLDGSRKASDQSKFYLPFVATDKSDHLEFEQTLGSGPI